MVVATDTLDLEQVGPNLRQSDFHCALWLLIAATDQCIAVRCRQGLAVEFAVRGQRHCVETHVGHRDHVGRQLLLQPVAQAIYVRLSVRCLDGVISHQTLVARNVLARGDYRFMDRRVFGQACIDLAQFDTETTDLHLIVVTAQVFDIAVWQIATQVASAVHTCRRLLAERVVEEALGGQVVTVQVATGHTGAADVDLAHNAQWNGLLLFIQQVKLRVADRFADVRSEAFFAIHRHPARIGGGFRRAIEVAQALHAGFFEQALHQAAFQRFTGHVHSVHRCRQAVSFQQRFQRRRYGVDQADVVLAVLQLQHVLDDFDAAARGERRKAFVDREVEVQRGGEQRLFQCRSVECTVCPAQEVHGVAVFDHHALWQTGRTRGVDQVRQMCRSQPRHLRIPDGFVLPVAQVKIDHRHRNIGQQALGSGLSQHGCRSAVLQHVSDAFYRIRRIQRHIPAARLEDRQQTDDHLGTALDTDPDAGIRLHALLAQGMGQAVGLLVKLAIGQALFAVNHRYRIRSALDLCFEQAMDGLLLRVIQRGVVERHQQLLTFGNRQDRQAVEGRRR